MSKFRVRIKPIPGKTYTCKYVKRWALKTGKSCELIYHLNQIVHLENSVFDSIVLFYVAFNVVEFKLHVEILRTIENWTVNHEDLSLIDDLGTFTLCKTVSLLTIIITHFIKINSRCLVYTDWVLQSVLVNFKVVAILNSSNWFYGPVGWTTDQVK